jgi:hypothetical protein
MTWVAPYAVAKSRVRLDESYDGIGMKDALTDLALQFWQPKPDGNGIERVQLGDDTSDKDTSDKAVESLRDWGHAHGVRVHLCIYNYSKAKEAWDWPWARSAFADHPHELAGSLVAEMDRLKLDGIDLDLEGNGSLDGDKKPYLAFVKEISEKVHARGKRLTVDSFAYVWHAPNQSWWMDLFPMVDGINSMGYEDIGAGAGSGDESWRSFASQEMASGNYVEKLMLGMPGNREEWRGKSAIEQLRWLHDRGQAGMSVWDSQLESAAWRTHEAWTLIADIGGRKPKRTP